MLVLAVAVYLLPEDPVKSLFHPLTHTRLFPSGDSKVCLNPAASYSRDPAVLNFISDNMPSWIVEPEIDGAGWLSEAVQTMWPSISCATSESVLAAVQPLLDSYCPAFLNDLRITEFDLGPFAPVISG